MTAQLGNRLVECLWIVGDGCPAWTRQASQLDLRGDHRTVAVDRTRCAARRIEFGAGRQDRHPWPASNRQVPVSRGRGRSHQVGIKPCTGGSDANTFLKVLAKLPDVRVAGLVRSQLQSAVAYSRTLLGDDPVGTARNGGTRTDCDRVQERKRLRKRTGRTAIEHDRPALFAQVRDATRKAVHGSCPKRGNVPDGEKIVA